jgi:hypothetical protein
MTAAEASRNTAKGWHALARTVMREVFQVQRLAPVLEVLLAEHLASCRDVIFPQGTPSGKKQFSAMGVIGARGIETEIARAICQFGPWATYHSSLPVSGPVNCIDNMILAANAHGGLEEIVISGEPTHVNAQTLRNAAHDARLHIWLAQCRDKRFFLGEVYPFHSERRVLTAAELGIYLAPSGQLRTADLELMIKSGLISAGQLRQCA